MKSFNIFNSLSIQKQISWQSDKLLKFIRKWKTQEMQNIFEITCMENFRNAGRSLSVQLLFEYSNWTPSPYSFIYFLLTYLLIQSPPEYLLEKMHRKSWKNIVHELRIINIKEYDTIGMNKFEKVGDAFSTYGARFEDSDATASLENAKETFNAVGKLHRDFKNTVAENVTSYLKQWIDVRLSWMRLANNISQNISGAVSGRTWSSVKLNSSSIQLSFEVMNSLV